MTAPASDLPSSCAAWLSAASVTLARAADDAEAGDVQPALERLAAAMAAAERARKQLRGHRRPAVADDLGDHPQQERP